MPRLRLDAEKRYHVVMVPEQGDAFVASFTTAEELAAHLKLNCGERFHVYIFHGVQWGITKGRMKHLINVDGAAIPLFDPAVTDLDPSGSLYVEDESKKSTHDFTKGDREVGAK